MTVHHLDVVQQLHATQPPEPTIAGALTFTLRVLAALPAAEAAGLLAKPSGDNILDFQGTLVAVGRICYPDGSLYKILTDIPTTMDPEWAENGTVDPGRYVEVISTPPNIPSPLLPPSSLDDVDAVIAGVRDELTNQIRLVMKQSDANTEKIQQQIDQVVKNAEASGTAILAQLVAILATKS